VWPYTPPLRIVLRENGHVVRVGNHPGVAGHSPERPGVLVVHRATPIPRAGTVSYSSAAIRGSRYAGGLYIVLVMCSGPVM